ncbi:hypothetical protein LIER_07864 [Lithospermum erythrorhizon]|uniref:Uncharacterized protein n=1 Tax=Lithospermum erythrorhizon TaxID=34254 RepID=A0AAV3PA49_LITER
MSSCNPTSTVIDTKSKLSGTSGTPCEDPALFRSLVGALQYLTFTRPDIPMRAEAEYRGVANAVSEGCWLRNLFLELHRPLTTATIVYCDDINAIYLYENPVQHQRTKHVELDIHFIREKVALGHVRILHVPSRYQIDEIFTKGLPSVLFTDFRDSLSIRPPPASTAGVY